MLRYAPISLILQEYQTKVHMFQIRISCYCEKTFSIEAKSLDEQQSRNFIKMNKGLDIQALYMVRGLSLILFFCWKEFVDEFF